MANTEDGSLLLVFQESRKNAQRLSAANAPELVSSSSSSLNLRKLVDVERVADDIVQGRCAITALRELHAIKEREDQAFPRLQYIAACSLMALSYGPLFADSGVYELLAATVIAPVVAAIEVFAPWRLKRYSLSMEIVVAFCASFLASSVHLLVAKINVINVVLSAIVFHLPGLGVTTAVMDVGFGNAHIGAGELRVES